MINTLFITIVNFAQLAMMNNTRLGKGLMIINARLGKGLTIMLSKGEMAW
ncbi:hypothetical protein [Pelistega europaea]|nr:hypothetical protein [Pelistega europaea]